MDLPLPICVSIRLCWTPQPQSCLDTSPPPPTSTTSIFMSHFLSTPPLVSPRFSPREIGLEILFSSLFPFPIPRLPRNLGPCCFSTPIFERPFLSSPLPRIPPSFDFEALFFPIGDVFPVLGIIDDVSTWLSGAFGTQPSEVRNRRGVGRDTTVSWRPVGSPGRSMGGGGAATWTGRRAGRQARVGKGVLRWTRSWERPIQRGNGSHKGLGGANLMVQGRLTSERSW